MVTQSTKTLEVKFNGKIQFFLTVFIITQSDIDGYFCTNAFYYLCFTTCENTTRVLKKLRTAILNIKGHQERGSLALRTIPVAESFQ